MRKKLNLLIVALFVTSLFSNCGENNRNTENKDSVISEQKTTSENNNNENKIVTAKFIDAYSLEGEADITFQKEDGSKIKSYKNYMKEGEPELKYMFIGDDGLSANKNLVGNTFEIKYKEDSKGRISIVSGEPEACNVIISVEKK